MEDGSRKPQVWLMATAAVLAVLTLYYYTGSWVVVGLFFALFAAFIVFQTMRGSRASVHKCVHCGAKLNANARQCDSCGSAAWTIRN